MTATDTTLWAERLARSPCRRGVETVAFCKLGAAALPIALEILTGKNRFGFPYDHQSRLGALGALQFFGEDLHWLLAARADSLLIDFVKRGDSSFRIVAIRVLGSLGRAASDEAILALASAMHDDGSAGLAMEATTALASIGGAPAIAGLVGFLEKKDAGGNWGWNTLAPHIARALGRIGPSARSAIPALLAAKRLDRGDNGLAEAVDEALTRIDV